MEFLPSKELVDQAYREGYAVPSFCVWNAETIETVLQAAAELCAPVMIMSGPSEFEVFPPDVMAEITWAIAKKYDVRRPCTWTTGIPGLAERCMARAIPR